MTRPPKKVVLTGMRTTGALHLGHYVGALKKWLELQGQGYECYFLLADVQAATTHPDNATRLRSVLQVTQDWLAVGLNPFLPNVHFVLQSEIGPSAEMERMYQMITGYNELIRIPTLKAEMKKMKTNDFSVGFLVYPISQIGDIFAVNPYPFVEGDEIIVPVGDDQRPIIEFAREITRRFNSTYGQIFAPCIEVVGEIGRLVGTDGNDKMSKSMKNSIELGDSPDVVRQKVMGMYTDSNHLTVDSPGDADNNPVFIYLQAFDPNQDEVTELMEHYRRGGLGDMVVKKRLVAVLNDHFLPPIHARRMEFADANLPEIIRAGSQAELEVCIPVRDAMREAMGLVIPKLF